MSQAAWGPPSVLVLGVGNADRGDDAVGRVVARRVREALATRGELAPAGPVAVLEHHGEGAALLEAWKDAVSVVVVDAAAPGTTPGRIHRIDAGSQPLPVALLRSTHAFGVAEAVGLARALGWLPRSLVVYAVEGLSFAAGTPMSPEVETAAADAAARVLDEVRTLRPNTAFVRCPAGGPGSMLVWGGSHA